MIDALLLLFGLVLLLVAADLLVKGASSVAARHSVSPLMIGLTVVSFGTSMPEMLVSFIAGMRGSADLAVANVLGSNIFNVLVVLGVACLINPLKVQTSTVVSEIPFSLSAAILLGFLANAALFSTGPELSISRLDGFILLGFFLLFMLYIFSISRAASEDDSGSPPAGSYLGSIAFILIGVAGLFLGGKWAVDGAVALAGQWGVDDAMIGLTIVAVGTSLPELAASAMAAYRKETDIAVGNVVGSNIFNILWILGVTASIRPLPFSAISNVDIVMVIVATLLILLAIASTRAAGITRPWGALFMAVYVAYMAYVIQRG
ncbi:MAG: calcium/sodium antiporter [Pseudomonadales bacterium]|nr:calcium/sodium antiporter [Halieaceae bacterium]MCB1846662.1 calcium/sodium antiporter [Halieaceae bacterium]MCP5191344.1 calcium/sodium antiporter [Pseudomonadales bacterium]